MVAAGGRKDSADLVLTARSSPASRRTMRDNRETAAFDCVNSPNRWRLSMIYVLRLPYHPTVHGARI